MGSYTNPLCPCATSQHILLGFDPSIDLETVRQKHVLVVIDVIFEVTITANVIITISNAKMIIELVLATECD